MEAPECENCVCAVTKIGYHCDASVPRGGGWVPGTACPFLVINAQEAELTAKEAEIDWLMGEYREAIRIIKQGKAQFAPDTTNSDADMFLRRAALKEVK